MRYTIIVLFLIGFVCSADWSTVNDISGDTRDIRNTLYDIYNQDNKMNNGDSHANSGSDGFMGWKLYQNETYKILREMNEGEKYEYKKVDGYYTNELINQNVWSNNNKTFFDLSDVAKDNTSEYANNILSYFSSNHNITFDNSKPDDMFLNYPNYGNVFYQIGNKITEDGFGIEDIKNSQQTKPLRDEVANVETKMKGMFSTDYTNSVLSYDFSELGNYFIRVNHWTTNPFLNLKGNLRIKPDVTDMHYELWHRYFDRSYSNYALALKFSLHTVMFLAFTIYVINDLMAIVNA